jgi:DMSO/TMAO reductase YedYZ molybdopterin-dependent catalytic subunit
VREATGAELHFGAWNELNRIVAVVTLQGLCEAPASLTWDDVDAMATGDALVEHTERLSPKVRGEGVKLATLLARARPQPSATHVVVHGAGEYFACLSLTDAASAVIAHRSAGAPLDQSAGGPLRLLVPQSDNACLSVKAVERIELVPGTVPDTVPRPTTPLRSR